MKSLMWLASYPKSGSTWTRAFLACYHLDARSPLPLARINEVSRSESRYDAFCAVAGKSRSELKDVEIDRLRATVQANLARHANGKIVIKTHNARVMRNGCPLICQEFTRAAIYVVRNPLDIVDSLADHANVSLDKAIALLHDRGHRLGGPNSVLVPQYVDSWSQHVESWISSAAYRVQVVRYEDLKSNPTQVFESMIQFLGWEFDPDRLQRAIQFSNFETLQKVEETEDFAERSQVARSGKFFRFGEAGRWRKLLSDTQVESIIEMHGVTMNKLGYANFLSKLPNDVK